jgi:holo-[acyl-carrier protein] synthase
MIYGVGTDIINIDRVEQILNKNKDGFVHRVLSEHEQALFANKGDSAAYCHLISSRLKPNKYRSGNN